MSTTELKADLHARIELMDEKRLSLVEGMLLRLEAEEIAAQLNAGFDADRKAGLLTPERVQAVIDEVRAERRGR